MTEFVQFANEQFIELTINWLVWGMFVFMLMWSTYTDATEMKIENNFNKFLVISRIILIPLFPMDWWDLLGGIILFTLFLIIGMITNDGKMAGDIKYSGAFGLWAGFHLGLLSVLAGVLIIIPVSLIRSKLSKGEQTPLAPFIAIGTILILFITQIYS